MRRKTVLASIKEALFSNGFSIRAREVLAATISSTIIDEMTVKTYPVRRIL